MPKRHFAVTRSVALSLVVFSLSVAGHSAAAADLPNAMGLGLALALSACLTTAIIARRRTWVWLVGYLLGAQALIHVVLVMSTTGHHPSGMGLMPLVPGPSMLAGHAIASVIAAVVLARGEVVLASWASLASTALKPLFVAARPVGEAPALVLVPPAWASKLRDLDWDLARRGPPMRASV
jgi:hypothetical protein